MENSWMPGTSPGHDECVWMDSGPITAPWGYWIPAFAGMTTGVLLLEQPFWRREDQPAALDIDLGNGVAGEGNEHGGAARCWLHFDEIAGAEIVNGDHGADGLALAVYRGETDQLGVIPFLLSALRQTRPLDIKLGAVERLGGFARGHAPDAGDERLRGDAHALDLDGAASLILKRAVVRDGRRILGIGADAHLTLQSLRRPDLAQQHAVIVLRQGYSAAAFLASSRSMRFLPGSPFCGFIRASRFLMPATSRNRSTRSVGWAPCDSQCFTRSSTNLTRSPESLGRSGS